MTPRTVMARLGPLMASALIVLSAAGRGGSPAAHSTPTARGTGAPAARSTATVTAASNPSTSLDVALVVDTSDKLAPLLLSETLDFYIGRIPGDVERSAFVADPIGPEPVRLIVRKGHPLTRRTRPTLEECVEFDWVMQPLGGLMRQTVADYLIARQVPLPARIVSTSSTLMTLALIARTNAIAPIAATPSAPAAMSGVLLRFDGGGVTATGVVRLSSVASASAADCGRSAGSFASNRVTSPATCGGTSRRRSESCGTGAVRCAATTDWALPLKGGAPGPGRGPAGSVRRRRPAPAAAAACRRGVPRGPAARPPCGWPAPWRGCGGWPAPRCAWAWGGPSGPAGRGSVWARPRTPGWRPARPSYGFGTRLYSTVPPQVVPTPAGERSRNTGRPHPLSPPCAG